MSAIESFYQGRRVMVTGHTGFKGAWLALWLKQLGAEVVGYSLAPHTSPSLFDLAGVETCTQHHVADILDTDTLNRVIAETRPEVIFHLAAQTIVRQSYEEPAYNMAVNVLGTANVFEAARASGHACRIVSVTSDKCYDNREWVHGYRETDAMGGSDPYSASKGCAELVASSWQRSFFHGDSPVRLATARAGNVIGGGDWARDRIVVDCIRCLTQDEPIGIRNPSATRPWQHVLEPLSGYLWLGACLSSDQPDDYVGGWNFGPELQSVCSVQTLVEGMIRSWGSGEFRDLSDPNAVHEAKLLSLVWDKAFHQLKWQPAWDLAACITNTVAWYKQWHEGKADMADVTRKQITEYTDAARERGIAWAL